MSAQWESATDFERRFRRCKRALGHLMHKDHEMRLDCAGCLEVAGFLAVPGYAGNEEYPVGVDFEVQR